MSLRVPQPEPEEERDLLDAIPGFNRISSNLQRSVGPSCLLSMVIVALVLVLLRRYIRLPFPAMVVMAFFIWWVVLVVLVRFGQTVDDDYDDDY